MGSAGELVGVRECQDSGKRVPRQKGKIVEEVSELPGVF